MKDIKLNNMPAERSEQAIDRAEPTRDLPVFTPAVDIYENDEALLVQCDMPGVEQKNVAIDLDDDVLTITGHQAEQKQEGYQLVYRGYNTGIYRRAFTLVANIDRDKIKARLVDGVLNITLPKAEEARPRKIAVEAG